MKKIKSGIIYLIIILNSLLFGVGGAGATYLLISPGAEAAGMGEAMVAYSGTPIMSYYNPAALIFTNSGISVSRNKWLPSIFGNSHQTFLSLNYNVSIKHSIGANYQYSYLGEFLNTKVISLNYAYKLSDFSSVSIAVKQCDEKYYWETYNSASEDYNPNRKNIFYDLSFFRQKNNLNLGFHLANMGKPIAHIDIAQADPAPTNLSMGLFYTFYDDEHNKLSFSFQMDKLLVTRYQMMDWDGDGLVGGYDELGTFISENDPGAVYNKDGEKEYDQLGYFDDPWYKAIFTAWIDDWLLGGDIDYSGDRKIGGYTWNSELDDNEDGKPDEDELEPSETGIYGDDCLNRKCVIEKGTGDNRSFKNELEEMIYKFGIEYKYTESFLLRTGYFHNKEGKIFNPTIGFGIRLLQYGFDFGFTGGKKDSPRYNTKYFSIYYHFK